MSDWTKWHEFKIQLPPGSFSGDDGGWTAPETMRIIQWCDGNLGHSDDSIEAQRDRQNGGPGGRWVLFYAGKGYRHGYAEFLIRDEKDAALFKLFHSESLVK